MRAAMHKNLFRNCTHAVSISRIILGIALAGTRVMNRMRVEGGRRWVGRMTVCGLG